jgi:hypothetical protein
MKKFLCCLAGLVLILGVGGMASATLITFSFDPSPASPALPGGSDAAAISTYMSTVFGGVNSVTVSATGVPTSELNGLLGGTNDGYIESEPRGNHTIMITFDTPITSVSFDWARARDQFNAEYSTDNGSMFHNFFQDGADNNGSGNNGSGTFATFTLPAGVKVLSFHNGANGGNGDKGEIGLDNLVVDKDPPTVPEPTTLLLLGCGLLGLVGFRKKFRK